MKHIYLPLLAALSLSSCQDETTAPAETLASPVESLFVSTAPAEAISIAKLRSDAKPGDTVTFTGKVLGAHEVFMDGRAVMIMGDPEMLTSCDLKPDDECETPWDVCCDDAETITNNIVTVQVLGEDGAPLKTGLKGQNGLAELSVLTVTGTVADSSNADNMIVNAQSLSLQ